MVQVRTAQSLGGKHPGILPLETLIEALVRPATTAYPFRPIGMLALQQRTTFIKEHSSNGSERL